MGFMSLLFIWIFSTGVIGYFGYRYYLKPFLKRKFQVKKQQVNKLSNYGGPELELPPGIVLENDDENELNRKLKA